MFKQDSSNSDSENDNFDRDYCKKVAYEGIIPDSDRQDSQSYLSDSHPNKKRNNYSKKIQQMLNIQQIHQDKTKAIKRNCQSAKMSRNRKKIYLKLLEQRARELKNEIIQRKNNITIISQRIMNCFQRSNMHKYKFLKEKLNTSKKLLTLTKDIRRLKKEAELYKDQQLQKQINSGKLKNFTPQQRNEDKLILYITRLSSETIAHAKGETTKKQYDKTSKIRLNKIVQPQQNALRRQSQIKLIQKQQMLEMGIKSYLYEFGVKGSLRSDVVQRSKREWFNHLQAYQLGHNQSVDKSLYNINTCFHLFNQKAKPVDYYLRQLKQKIKPDLVVQFLLNKQFFSSDIQTVNEKFKEQCNNN